MRNMKRIVSLLVSILLGLSVVHCNSKGKGDALDSGSKAVSVGSIQEVTGFGTNPGKLKFYKYVPSTINTSEARPLVVVFHGCSQNATGYSTDSGWKELAEKQKFYVVFPEQQKTEDKTAKTGNQYGCFNWAGFYGDTSNLERGKGENQSVIEMVNYMKTNYKIDNDKVFASGLSAGAAMTVVMASTWPDVFSAVAPNAGIPYYCATDVDGAYACMGIQGAGFSPRQAQSGDTCNSGEACMDEKKKKDGATWANLVRTKGFPSGYTGRIPRLMVFQGMVDQYVDKDNMTEIVKQWTSLHGLDINTPVTGKINSKNSNHVYKQYKDLSGQTLVASVEINDMKHGITVDPGDAEEQGGKENQNMLSGGFSYNKQIFSSYYAYMFFMNGIQPPKPVLSAAITSPANNSQFKEGSITFTITATDDNSVSKVELIEGSNVYNASLSSGNAQSGTWTVSVSKTAGNYTFKARATDGDNNTAESTGISITVSKDNPNPGGTWTKEQGTFQGSGNVPQATFYTPEGIDKNTDASLVVYLHGCLESDTIGMNNTEWSVQADQYKFFVLFVKSTGVNQCFDWYSSGSQSAASGSDTAIIRSLIEKEKAKYPNIKKIYLSGLSAGAGMVVILSSLYPTEYKAGVVMSGFPFKGFTGAATSTLSYINNGVDKTPAQWAALMPKNPGVYPPLLEIHGTSDTTVNFKFQQEVVDQWTGVQGTDQTADQNRLLTSENNIKGHTYKEYWSSDNTRFIIGTIAVNGMTHGISVDPKGTGVDKGGKTGNYAFDKGMNSTYYSMQFFAKYGLFETDNAPSVQITAPANNSQVSSNFTISANASDDKGISKVDFYVNGQLKCTASSAPYECVVDIASYANGSQLQIQAIATDTKPQTGSSSIINVTVVKAEPTVLITSPTNGSKTNAQAITVKSNANYEKGIVKVEFYVNEVLKATLNQAPYESTLDLSSYSDGNLTIKALAYGSDSKVSAPSQVTIYVDRTAPSITQISPAAGEYPAGTVITFTANEDAVFYYTLDGNTPGLSSLSAKTITLNDLGTFNLKVLAVDSAGNQSAVFDAGQYKIIQNDVNPPSIVISSPKESCYSGICNPAQITGTISLSGTATDDNKVQKVVVTVSQYQYSYLSGTPTLIQTVDATVTANPDLKNVNWNTSISGLTKYKYYKVEVKAIDGSNKESTVQSVRIFQM